ncbi:MAG: hypothetical protein CME39_09770 [Haliea sp.]|nr:hypothetical protein [Haliea sp.]
MDAEQGSEQGAQEAQQGPVAPGVSAEQVRAELDALVQETGGEAPQGAPGAPAAPEPEPDPLAEYQELLEPVLFLGFQVLAPNWEITAPEARQLSAGYAPVLAKYFPDGPGAIGPEVGAALLTVSILAPRLGKPRKAETENPGQESDAEAGDIAPRAEPDKAGEAQVKGALPE